MFEAPLIVVANRSYWQLDKGAIMLEGTHGPVREMSMMEILASVAGDSLMGAAIERELLKLPGFKEVPADFDLGKSISEGNAAASARPSASAPTRT